MGPSVADGELQHKKVPRVHIGMPVYNDQRYVSEALDSLLSQSFGDFQLIISDNASTDGTLEICEQYARADERVQLIRQPVNRGLTANLNAVLAAASAEYFMWAASDDVWDPEYLSTLYPILASDPVRSLVFGQYIFIDDDGVPFGGVRRFDYSSSWPFVSLLKFLRGYDDGCFYGLFRRRALAHYHIPTWWGMNQTTPYNNAYPLLCHAIAAGGFAFVDEGPLWLNRIKRNAAHPGPASRHRFTTVNAYLLRKVNVLVECTRAVNSGSHSAVMTVAASGPLAARCIYDCGNFLGFAALSCAAKSLGRNRHP